MDVPELGAAAPRQARTNPFLDRETAARYEAWYESGAGRRADLLEKRLLQKMLGRIGGVGSIVEIGCGTGHFTRWFGELGWQATGFDSSPAMLEEARLRNGGEYLAGDAGALPCPDRSFDVAALITTLEFLPDPAAALAEAARVARRGLVLGVLNRHSLLVRRYRRSGNPLWSAARFFTPGELAALVGRALGARAGDIYWRTTLWPRPFAGDCFLPWGGFIGMGVRLK